MNMSLLEMKQHRKVIEDAFFNVFDKFSEELQSDWTGYGISVDDDNKLYITINFKTYKDFNKLPQESNGFKIQYSCVGVTRLV